MPRSAWFDLDQDERHEAHDAAAHSRIVEAALDPEGLPTTARESLRGSPDPDATERSRFNRPCSHCAAK